MKKLTKPDGMSAYEFIYGHQNPLHGNPYELNKVECNTELKWYALRKAMSMFRMMVEDDVIKSDAVFPLYCCPSKMPLANGSIALRKMFDTWRNMVQGGKAVTYDTILAEVKERLDTTDFEVATGIVDYCKNQPQDEYESLINRDELKLIMMKGRMQELMAYVPHCFLYEGIDISDGMELDEFMNDFDRMYRFLINLNFIKDCVKRVTGALENVTNPYDYEL